MTKATERLVVAFSSYLQHHQTSMYRYAGYKGGSGCLLVKDLHTGVRIAVRPWLRKRPVGQVDLQKSNLRYRSFRGQTPSSFVHVATSFRATADRLARQGQNTTLVTLNTANSTAAITGSRNVSPEFFNVLLKFAEQQGLKVTYDFAGDVVHKGYRRGVPQVDDVKPQPQTPKVFISYSWDSQQHQRWVLRLAADLIKNGVHVLIDEWDLADSHDDLNVFMETGIRESSAVILVCTQAYATRADKRTGGVGAESSIITGEFYDPAKAGKYIPIVRGAARGTRTCLPSYLKSRFAIDFTQDDQYSSSLDQLLRRLFARPRFRKPTLGNPPHLTSEDP